MCHLCDGFVSRLIRWDKEEKLLFAANQSQKGQTILTKFGSTSQAEGTVFFLENDQLYTQSTAVLRILRLLPFPFSLMYGLSIFPAPIRDVVYGWISRNRYRWFGKRNTCRMPTPEEMKRFI
ncbi:MAG: DCC1-like thiol-disulfide oxidoreductase family protein, partial [Bacteroidota bacterium]